MERDDDAQLIQNTLAGDDAAFNTLVEKYQKGVHVLAWRKIGDFHYAEDITQDTFLRAYEKLSTLRNPNQFAGWLYVIANRLCISWLQRRKPAMQSLETLSVKEIDKLMYERYLSEQRESQATERRYEIVEKILETLPDSERTVMTLYYLGEMTIKEISNFLGISANTIGSRLRRAKKRLQADKEGLIQQTFRGLQLSELILGGITAVKVQMNTKIIIGVVGVLVAGFTGFIKFQAQKTPPPDITIIKPVVIPEARRITASQFIERTPETGTKSQQEPENIAFSETKSMPLPESVPSAESTDDEIMEFQAWLSAILEEDDSHEETQQENSNAEDNGIDHDLERALIRSVVENQWENSFENYDIDGYMAAIWENDFFYTSDMGTPDNLNDDMILRSGAQERAAALNMFNNTQDIELNLSRNGDIEFLSDTLAMADYDYQLKLVFPEHGAGYPSGRMIFILELRENDEWRILEWYDYATPDP